MARDLTSDFITEIDAQALRAEIFVKIFFDSGTTYNWTGIGDITWNGESYAGLGDHVAFGRMEETTTNRANGTVMQLSGVKSSLVSIALQEEYQGRRAEIYFAVMSNLGAVIPDPYQIFAGQMDVMEIEDSGEESTISVTVENDQIDLQTPRIRNYTPEDQRSRFPNDKGLDFLVQIQDVEIVWKEKTPSR